MKIDPVINLSLGHFMVATNASGNLANDRFDVRPVLAGYLKPLLSPLRPPSRMGRSDELVITASEVRHNAVR